LSTANESKANHFPSGENALNVANELDSLSTGTGWDIALVDTGRDLGGFCFFWDLA
jgi:hypothetical protein